MRHEAILLHDLPLLAAERSPQSMALQDDSSSVGYAELAGEIERFSSALATLGVGRGERVAIYLDKRRETVSASFGAPAHGSVFVPINPLLKAEQVAYILRDCGVRVLVTSSERLQALAQVLTGCPELAHVIVVGSSPVPALAGTGVAVHG